MSGLPLRDDSVTTQRACASCGRALTTIQGRQRYCDQACRQQAYRDRQSRPVDVLLEPAASRRASGVYQCPQCQTRYVGQQRCQDCNVFCARVGTGGACPSCEEAVTLDELLPT